MHYVTLPSRYAAPWASTVPTHLMSSQRAAFKNPIRYHGYSAVLWLCVHSSGYFDEKVNPVVI